MKTVALAAAMLVAAASSPAIAAAKNGGDAQIPFVSDSGIFDWSAPDDQTLFMQGQDGNWYQASMAAPCNGLSAAKDIDFDTGGLAGFDRHSKVLVNGQRCAVQSLTQLDSSPVAKKPRGAGGSQ